MAATTKAAIKEPRGFDALFDIIDRSNNKNTEDKDILPEKAQKATWEDKVHELKRHRYHSDTITRICLAATTQFLIFLWMACVVVILMLNNSHFLLSSGVLITILGTTTATVLGLALIVLQGFFRNMKQDVDLKD